MALAKYSTTPAIINRRQLFAAAPALALLPAMAVAKPMTSDPVIDLCRQYHVADNEVERLGALPGGEEYDTPEIEALCDQRADLFRAVSKMVPTTLEGVAAIACVLVADDVGWAEAEYYSPADWMQANLAKGARALIG